MREIKFRGMDISGEWCYGLLSIKDGKYYISNRAGAPFAFEVRPETVGQYTGLHDSTKWEELTEEERSEWTRSGHMPSEWKGKEYYIGDIGEFENGDRFVIRLNEWLEFYIDWIGDPECEDQARDLYRISNAKKIGNIHDNPELLKTA